jgi:hypothetical protein
MRADPAIALVGGTASPSSARSHSDLTVKPLRQARATITRGEPYASGGWIVCVSDISLNPRSKEVPRALGGRPVKGDVESGYRRAPAMPALSLRRHSVCGTCGWLRQRENSPPAAYSAISKGVELPRHKPGRAPQLVRDVAAGTRPGWRCNKNQQHSEKESK